MSNSKQIYKFIKTVNLTQSKSNNTIGCTTNYVANHLNISRANVSNILNQLHREGLLNKSSNRPVLYSINESEATDSLISIDTFFSNFKNSNVITARAKAAMTFPPYGLNACLIGEEGSGKSLFAKLMHDYACEEGVLNSGAPFYKIKCKKYQYNDKKFLEDVFGLSNNNVNNNALVFKANNGIIFLEEPHLLLPETQEKLFHFMNQKNFLGFTKEYEKVSNVIFICACSGRKNNSLIEFFSNNFPIVIEIPALRKRSLQDRLEYINIFFQLESDKLQKKIIVDLEVIECLLLYNCRENLCELKRDIINICEYATYNQNIDQSLSIHMDCLNSKIKQGLYNYKTYQNQIFEILEDKEEFVYCVGNNTSATEQFITYGNYHNLHTSDNKSKASQFKDSNYYNDVQISKIFDNNIVEIAKTIFNSSTERLGIKYDKKAFFGLCMYLHIYLNDHSSHEFYTSKSIQDKHYKEYQTIKEMIPQLKKQFDFEVSDDTIAHITTFLIDENMTYNSLVPPVIVAMHGLSTASALVQTIKQFMYIENVHAFDIHLNKEMDTIYRELKTLISNTNYKQGLLLLTDMNSINTIGKAIGEELNINIKVVNDISTYSALKYVYKINHYRNIKHLYEDHNHIKVGNDYQASNLIVITCINNQDATTTKNYIEENIDCNALDIEIKTISTCNEQDINTQITTLNKDYNVIVVSETSFKTDNIPFLSFDDVLIYDGLINIVQFAKSNTLKSYQQNTKVTIYNNVISNFNTLNVSYNVAVFKPLILKLLEELETIYNIVIPCDMGIGIICHISATLSLLIDKRYESNFKINEGSSIDQLKFQKVRALFHPLENTFNIVFNDDEVYIIEYTLAGIHK